MERNWFWISTSFLIPNPICVSFCISPSNTLESFNWVTARAVCYDPGWRVRYIWQSHPIRTIRKSIIHNIVLYFPKYINELAIQLHNDLNLHPWFLQNDQFITNKVADVTAWCSHLPRWRQTLGCCPARCPSQTNASSKEHIRSEKNVDNVMNILKQTSFKGQ